jgi:hypothetical protein
MQALCHTFYLMTVFRTKFSNTVDLYGDTLFKYKSNDEEPKVDELGNSTRR